MENVDEFSLLFLVVHIEVCVTQTSNRINIKARRCFTFNTKAPHHLTGVSETIT